MSAINKKMEFLGYIWSVIKNIFALVVVCVAISKTSSDFETLVVVLLICIIMSIWANANNLSSAWFLFILPGFHNEFKRIRKLLNVKLDEYEEAGIKREEEEHEKAHISFYIHNTINTIGFTLITIIIVITLVYIIIK